MSPPRTSSSPDLAYRISFTSTPTSASAHARSAVRAGTPSRAASTRQERSPSDSPCGLVIGRSRATSMQSAAVSGSIESSPGPFGLAQCCRRLPWVPTLHRERRKHLGPVDDAYRRFVCDRLS